MKDIIIYPLLFLTLVQCASQQEAESTQNMIMVENAKKGSRDWIIEVEERHCDYPDHQYCRRPEIEGYCSRTSYKAGEKLSIFVSTNPPSPYSLDIFRMGYYGGNGGRLVKSISNLYGIPQEVPDADSTNFFECQWDTAYQMVIPADWLSGVYLGKLTTETNFQSYIVFIIRDDRQADFMFQCSDLTWQAYNRWPEWHSMYDENQDPWVNSNGARISFDRPYALYVNGLPMDFNALSNGSGEFLLWEFSLSFWMEREGYDVTYISNIDTHEDREGLLRSRAFLSVGHDEYWTPEMYSNVEYARDEGVSLLFLCGNAVDGTVYLEPSTDGRPNRITGRLPQRFLEDERNLMGNSSYGVGYASFVVKNADHWVYANAGVQEGDTIHDLIGWEYHGYPVKEDSSLVILSENTLDPNKFTDPEGPNHAAVIYMTNERSFVFNAGTCFWNLSLSTPPAFQNPVNSQDADHYYVVDFKEEDSRVQQITRNLLARALQE